MKIEIVNPSNVDSVWPLISDRVVACLQKTPTDIGAGEFWQMCRSGSAFLIVCYDKRVVSASVWQFRHEGFTCLLLVGDKSGDWVRLLFDTAANLAKANGTTKLAATGRIGLGVMLKRNLSGVKITRQTYSMEV